ncbi:hypothetical protein KBC99_01305 [Candidatus Saccharibacteria bacterium]|nr:hypothetical protein [Candidatus Saccharibacteria bacterium]
MAASGHYDETREFIFTSDNEEDAAILFFGLVGSSALWVAVLAGITFVGKAMIARRRR